MSVQTAYTITNPASRGRCHSCRYLIASLTAITIKAKFIIILSAVVAVILVVIDSQIRLRLKASAQAAFSVYGSRFAITPRIGASEI